MNNEIGQISVYLAKSDRTFDSVLDPESDLPKSARTSDFKTHGASCRFIYFENRTSKDNPPWLDFINEKLPEADRVAFQAKSYNANGILFAALEKRVFVATFGRSASSYINKRSLEPEFGIKTAMNMCGNEELRQTKSQSNTIAVTHIDRQVSKPSDTVVFGLGDAEDLTYISAHMKGNQNVTLQGRASLTIKIIGKDKLTWKRFIEYCRIFLEKFASKDFLDLFPNYKNFDPATEQEVVALDEALVAALRAKDFSKIQLCVPEFTSDDDYSFAYTNSSSKENIVYAYLQVSQLKRHLKLDTLDVKKLYAKKIYAYSPEEDRILDHKRWPLYDCLIFEHSLNGKYFILRSGEWLRIEDKFYDSIVGFVENVLRVEPCEAVFENIDISDDVKRNNREEIFNEKVVRLRSSCVLFDRAKLQIGGGIKNKEFCDVLDLQDNGEMRIIDTKQLKDAASINYLFQQAKFYCEAFLRDPTFLAAIRDHIDKSICPKKAKYLEYIEAKNEDVRGEDYRLCLWLLYNRAEAKPKKEDLPLIAQYELKLLHEYLRRVFKLKAIVLRFVPVTIKQYTKAIDPTAAA